MKLMKVEEFVELGTLIGDLVTSASVVRHGVGRTSWHSRVVETSDVRVVVFGAGGSSDDRRAGVSGVSGEGGSGIGSDNGSAVEWRTVKIEGDTMTDKESDDDADQRLFLFVTYGVLLTMIGLLGLAGNTLSIVVLSRPQMRSSINCCLIGLASFDIVVLVTSVLMFGVFNLCTFTGTFPFYERTVHPFLVPLALYPLGLIAQTGSVWVTVTVTVERFVAVCLPLHARSLCTYGRARAYIVIIALFSVVYNLPRFWEVQRDAAIDPETNDTVYSLQPSWLRQNPTYVNVYITWMYLFAIYFVPFVLLAVLNGVIWMRVRRANRERQQLSRLQKKEMGLAIMLFCVVVVFFMCNVLALVVNVLEAVGVIVDELTVSSNLLVTMNSSVNFCIYCIFGQKFRKILLKTVCSRCFRVLFFRTRRGQMSNATNDMDESFCPVSTTMAETRTLLLNNNGGAVGGGGAGTGGNNGGIHLNHPTKKSSSSSSSLQEQLQSSSSSTAAKANVMSMSVLSSSSSRVNQGSGSRLSRTTSLAQRSDSRLTLT